MQLPIYYMPCLQGREDSAVETPTENSQGNLVYAFCNHWWIGVFIALDCFPPKCCILKSTVLCVKFIQRSNCNVVKMERRKEVRNEEKGPEFVFFLIHAKMQSSL